MATRRGVAAALCVLALVVAPAVGAGVVSHTDYENPYRLFYADDPDDETSIENVSEVIGNDTSIPLANVTDVYYDSTKPTFEVGPKNYTLAEYRRQQLFGVERERNTSKYLPHSSRKDSDGGVIKDAHITFMGVNGGAKPVLAKRNDYPLLLDGDGEVLNFLDYRVDDGAVPEGPDCTPDTEMVNGSVEPIPEDGSCTDVDYELSGVTTEDRTLTIGSQEWVSHADDPAARSINYTNATADGVVLLELSANVSVDIERTETNYEWDGDEWKENTTTTTETRSVTVTDSRRVVVTDDAELTVEQRVVNFTETGEHRVVVNISGPDEVTERLLWSRMKFSENVSVQNSWGTYTVTRYDHGCIADGEDDSGCDEYDFPHVLEMRLNTGLARPYVDANYSATSGRVPTIERVETRNYSEENASLGENVNLTSSQSTFKTQFVFSDAPGEVSGIVGIHGNEFSVDSTERIEVHEAAVKFTNLGDNRTKIRLVDAETGEGLADRRLNLTGAERDAATTNESGVVVVTRRTDSDVLAASFEGDDWWNDERDRYYAVASASQYYVPMDNLVSSFVNLVWGGLRATPFVIALLFLRSMDTV